ncbi:MAG: hypothetical protein AAF515_07930 [Pseudomonadota bacterium]
MNDTDDDVTTATGTTDEMRTAQRFRAVNPSPTATGYPNPAGGEVDTHTIEARQAVRDQLALDIEAFLTHGGQVEQLEPCLRADPPKAPKNNYGRGSI